MLGRQAEDGLPQVLDVEAEAVVHADEHQVVLAQAEDVGRLGPGVVLGLGHQDLAQPAGGDTDAAG